MLDGLAFDVGPFTQDAGGSAEVDVRPRHVAQALVASGVVIVLDEGVYQNRPLTGNLNQSRWRSRRTKRNVEIHCRSALRCLPIFSYYSDPADAKPKLFWVRLRGRRAILFGP